jgi:hypothetical protein
MLPTTGFVGGRGIGLSLLLDAICEVRFPALSSILTVIARSTCDEAIHAFCVGRWIASLRSQ